MSQERDREAPTAFSSVDPPRNFKLGVEERVRALVIGVPAWSERKRRIEDAEDTFVGELVELAGTLAGADRATALLARARTFDLRKVNVLIEKHNRYFPIEANLRMDRAGRYLVQGRRWAPEPTWTPELLVARAEERMARSEDD